MVDNKELQMKNSITPDQIIEALRVLKLTCTASSCSQCPLRSVEVVPHDPSSVCSITTTYPANWSIKSKGTENWRAFHD